jgi:tRNA nucleotidyltransferase/poly(A) polymerase
MDEKAMAQRIAEKVSQKGGRAYIVGGCVRDKLMGRVSFDMDL